MTDLSDFVADRITEERERIENSWTAPGNIIGSRCPACGGFIGRYDIIPIPPANKLAMRIDHVPNQPHGCQLSREQFLDAFPSQPSRTTTFRLAELEAIDHILGLCDGFMAELVEENDVDGYLRAHSTAIVKRLAAPYSDHPDYRREWRP